MNLKATQETETETSLAGRILMPIASLLALLSASCCVLPIGLSIIGLGGSWLTVLGLFIAYREAIFCGVAIALVWAWYRVLRLKPYTIHKRSVTIWTMLATTAFLVALSSPYWESLAQRFMWDLWSSSR